MHSSAPPPEIKPVIFCQYVISGKNLLFQSKLFKLSQSESNSIFKLNALKKNKIKIKPKEVEAVNVC